MRKSLDDLTAKDEFISRHIGVDDFARETMLRSIGATDLKDLIERTVPASIRLDQLLNLGEPMLETDVLTQLRVIASKNIVRTSLIGMGYYNTVTPPVIARNVLENPAWYTSYTPYQPEISQGRLEALLNFQTMITEITGFEIANASLLDEATAAAEAMTIALRSSKSNSTVFAVDIDTHPQIISVLKTRALPIGLTFKIVSLNEMLSTTCFGALISCLLRDFDDTSVGISFDETSNLELIKTLFAVFEIDEDVLKLDQSCVLGITQEMRRSDEFLTQVTFSKYRTEHEMLRYLRRLADKDLALDQTMIPLGSCTMKLNATTEMIPVTWPEFANIHPLAPASDIAGYTQLVAELSAMLIEITGYDAISLQPNAGSQGELAGLLAIRAYHRSRSEEQRVICLIPSSAHGTNAASAVMAGMSVVVVACDDRGNVDLNDLRTKCELAGNKLAALMITYPSTHGVFEQKVTDICELVHSFGGQVYVDGANLNALVGVAQPGHFGADVSHLNLHKTFCIPHGGGGPGVGPVGVKKHLAEFLPSHPLSTHDESRVGAVAAAPNGSASILPISWVYIKLMGAIGLRSATMHAILSANYIANRLDAFFPVLYRGEGGFVAHECILDIREITKLTGVTNDDIAKRLMDFGFHAPTMSFPVSGTFMVEPTESETLAEIDRFCNAMIAIHKEIQQIAAGTISHDDSPLHHAPHTVEDLCAPWNRKYSQQQAAYPISAMHGRGYFAPVSRIDAVFGDRNLVCSCEPLESYAISLQ